MPDLGKNIKWPAPKPGFVPISNFLKKVFQRWRALKIIQRIPAEKRPILELKLSAMDFLQQRSSFVKTSLTQEWKGDLLSLPNENQNAADYLKSVNELRAKDRFDRILFSAIVTKLNSHFKTDERAIVLTNKFLYKLDPKKHFHLKKTGIPIESVNGISVTTGNDQLIVVHLAANHDLIVYISTKEDRVGEFAANIIQLKKKSNGFSVNVPQYVSAQIDKHKYVINTILADVEKVEFRKGSNRNITLNIPNH